MAEKCSDAVIVDHQNIPSVHTGVAELRDQAVVGHGELKSLMQLMRLTLLLTLLLLCSCATQRRSEELSDGNKGEQAEYADKNTGQTEKHEADTAVRHFPARPPAPAMGTEPTIVPGRLVPCPMPEARPTVPLSPGSVKCPACETIHTTETIYVEDTTKLDALRVELNTERTANTVTRQRLRETEAERDFWREKNRKKFWTLIAMVAFAVLYMVFRVLASRVRET